MSREKYVYIHICIIHATSPICVITQQTYYWKSRFWSPHIWNSNKPKDLLSQLMHTPWKCITLDPHTANTSVIKSNNDKTKRLFTINYNILYAYIWTRPHMDSTSSVSYFLPTTTIVDSTAHADDLSECSERRRWWRYKIDNIIVGTIEQVKRFFLWKLQKISPKKIIVFEYQSYTELLQWNNLHYIARELVHDMMPVNVTRIDDRCGEVCLWGNVKQIGIQYITNVRFDSTLLVHDSPNPDTFASPDRMRRAWNTWRQPCRQWPPHCSAPWPNVPCSVGRSVRMERGARVLLQKHMMSYSYLVSRIGHIVRRV